MKIITLYSDWEVSNYAANNPDWAIVSITPLKKDMYTTERVVGQEYPLPVKQEVIYAFTVVLQEIK